MSSRLLGRLRHDGGLALPTVIGVMLLVAALTAALLTTVQADTGLSRRDQDRKAAYAAAEAGLNAYLFRLADDPNVWSNCTSIGGTPYVSQAWDGTGSDTRAWRSIPGSAAQYTVELLPKPGRTSCNPTTSQTAADSVFDQGILRLRATGRMRGLKRSIVMRLRRQSFLDYIYFTNYETMDPVWYTRYAAGATTTPDLVAWASANCRYWRDARSSELYTGDWSGSSHTVRCTEINFVTNDVINGPFHTNDSILTCGSPALGGGAGTSVELNAPFPGWRANGSCGAGPPTFSGTLANTKPKILALPPTNATLLNDALPAYVFTGTQNIVLGDTTLTVNGVSMPYPANGLIYVKNGACGEGYKAYDPYNQVSGCANVFVHSLSTGYGTSLTIGSQKDIVVDDDIVRKSTKDVVLGLVANEFVRVGHVVSPTNSDTCSNSSPVQNDIRIEAAILTLSHSFAVDNYFCGATMGTLHVLGSISQNYRGAVGTIGNSGYLKDYQYDPRLAYRSPPHFLDPVSAGWRVLTQNEQTPAR